MSLSKVSSEVVAEQPQVTGVEEAADNYVNSPHYDDFGHKGSFKAGAAWQASQPTPPLPKLSAEEVLKKYRHDTTWLTREAYGKDKVIAAMQEYATTSPDNKLTDALELLEAANKMIEQLIDSRLLAAKTYQSKRKEFEEKYKK